MFGNTQGWIISAVVAVAMGWLLFYAAMPPARTDPTNATVLAVAKKEIELPVPWTSIASPGSTGGDAGLAYQKVIDSYLLTPDTYEKFQAGGRKILTFKESDLPGIADIVSGRDFKTCSIFSKDPGKVVNYDNAEPGIDALVNVGNICCTMGLLYTKPEYPAHDPKRAIVLWESAFVLGGHLYDERMSWLELVGGHNLMQGAASGLLEYYKSEKNQNEVDKIQKFVDAENEYQQKLLNAFTIIGGIQEEPSDQYKGVGIYAGDIYQIAESAKISADPMFRTECIKHIGRYRYDASNRGDQLAAGKVLRLLSQAPGLPPNVKAAADAARDLTVDQYHKMGGS